MSEHRFASSFGNTIGVPVLWCLLPLAVLFALLPAVLAAQPQAKRPNVVRQRPGGSAAASHTQAEVLTQHVFRSRRQQVMLNRGIEALDRGQMSEGLTVLQRLLTQGEDGFIWLDDERRLTSVRQVVIQRFDRFSRTEQKSYEQLVGSEAEFLLEAANRTQDIRGYQEICRKYLHTIAGFQAGNRLATKWLDQGRPLPAAQMWEHLYRTTTHRRRITDMILFKLMIAWRAVGDEDKVAEWKSRLQGNRVVSLGGRDGSINDWLERPVLTSYLSPRKTPTGTAERHPSSRDSQYSLASAPYWRPQWTHPFRLWRSPTGAQLLSHWEAEQASSLNPLSVSNFPLAVRGTVYIRSPHGVLAIDKRSGETVWEYPAESSLSQLVGEREQQGRRGQRALSRGVQIDYAYAHNSLMGTLTSDGERLYAVDATRLERYRHHRMGGTNPHLIDDDHLAEIERRNVNRLVALPLKPSVPAANGNGQPGEQVPLWSIGGEPRGTDAPLAGHFFLGPPVALDGVLYVLTEVDRQINLVALEPKTGDVLWSQGLCFVDNPIGIDSRRSLLSCTPIAAQGILLCPTHLQSLIAVEAHSGSLLWAARLGDASFEPDMNRWPNVATSGSATYPFAENVLVDGHRILHLPHESESISCLDLSTGRLLWQAPAEDTDYLAAVDRGILLAVGRRYTRGLSTASGDELWSTWLGTPSGQGVQIGSSYLVPLERGRIANLEIGNGREIGVSREESYQNVRDDWGAEHSPRGDEAPHVSAVTWRPGNLIADGTQVISVGLRDVTAFPQAAARLKQVHEQLTTQKSTTELELLTAELELTLGHFPEARKRLVRLFNSPQAKPFRTRIESSLRPLLYAELKENTGDRNALLAQLSVLSRHPIERARYLTFKADADLNQGDLEGVLKACREFAELELPALIPSSENPEHYISAASWIPGVIERVQQQIGTSEVDRLWTHIDEEQQSVLAGDDVDALKNFLLVYAQWPQAAAVRLELAKRCFERGDYQQVELYLLPVRQSDSPVAAAEATRLLFDVWSTAGLKHEAVDLLLDLKTKYADVMLADGQTGKTFAQRALRGMMVEIASRRNDIPWTVDRVAIRGSLDPDVMLIPGDDRKFEESGPYLRLAYDKYRRRFPMPQQSSLYLLDKGTNQGGQFAVINKHVGLIVGEIDVESNYNYSSAGSDCHVGHFFPLGTIGRMHGISLLEHRSGKPAWTIDLENQFGKNEVVRVGPVTPSHCIFQTRQALIAVDPASGNILWQRSDLLPTSGLTSDNSAGLIGDEHVLVMFHSDRKRYTVYDTATGQILRYGQLDIDSRMQRTVLGRKLFYVTGNDGEKRMRIWDPLSDRFELEEPVNDHHFSYQTAEDELLLINAAHQLKIYNVKTGEVSLTLQLTTKQLTNLNYLRTFRDRDHYYINFQEAVRFVNTHRTSFYATDTFLPSVHVQGTLWCVDRHTGDVMWERSLPQRSILQLDEYPLPFLVMMSKERGQSDSTRQSLAVEAIDIATGDTIGRCENLFPDKMVKLKYDHAAGKLTLFGIKSKVELSFDKARQQVPTGDEPL